jgi:hypothetical protein
MCTRFLTLPHHVTNTRRLCRWLECGQACAKHISQKFTVFCADVELGETVAWRHISGTCNDVGLLTDVATRKKVIVVADKIHGVWRTPGEMVYSELYSDVPKALAVLQDLVVYSHQGGSHYLTSFAIPDEIWLSCTRRIATNLPIMYDEVAKEIISVTRLPPVLVVLRKHDGGEWIKSGDGVYRVDRWEDSAAATCLVKHRANCIRLQRGTLYLDCRIVSSKDYSMVIGAVVKGLFERAAVVDSIKNMSKDVLSDLDRAIKYNRSSVSEPRKHVRVQPDDFGDVDDDALCAETLGHLTDITPANAPVLVKIVTSESGAHVLIGAVEQCHDAVAVTATHEKLATVSRDLKELAANIQNPNGLSHVPSTGTMRFQSSVKPRCITRLFDSPSGQWKHNSRYQLALVINVLSVVMPDGRDRILDFMRGATQSKHRVTHFRASTTRLARARPDRLYKCMYRGKKGVGLRCPFGSGETAVANCLDSLNITDMAAKDATIARVWVTANHV